MIKHLKRAAALENTTDSDTKILARTEGAIRRVQQGTASRGDVEAIRQGMLRLRRMRDNCFCDFLSEWRGALAIMYPEAGLMSQGLAFERLGTVIKRLEKLSQNARPAEQNVRLADFAAYLRNAFANNKEQLAAE